MHGRILTSNDAQAFRRLLNDWAFDEIDPSGKRCRIRNDGLSRYAQSSQLLELTEIQR